MIRNICSSRGWVDMSREGFWETLHAVTVYQRLPVTE